MKLISQLVVGQYFDVLDSAGNWCVGIVMLIDYSNKKVNVHFESWTNRYDESIDFSSNRIAAFRTMSKGYTGQKKEAFRPGFSQTKVELKLVSIIHWLIPII